MKWLPRTPSRLLAVLALAYLLAASPETAESQGFPNADYPPTEVGELVSGPHAPQQGRTALVAFHNGVLYTVPEGPSSFQTAETPVDLQVRAWNLADAANPVMLGLLGPTRQPISAHGYLKAGNQLIIGDNMATPETSWAFAATGIYGQNTRGFWTDQPGGTDGGVGDRGRLYHPFHATMWWSYSPISGYAVLSRVGGPQNSNQPLATWDHLGYTGVIGHPFIIGNLLVYASDDSRTGVATYDISDTANPVLLDVLTDGGPGGYWPELWGGDGRLYVVWPYRENGHGLRVVDITDPADIQWVIDLPLGGDEPMYMAFQDEFAFTANYKIDMRTLEVAVEFDSANAVHTMPGNPYNNTGVGIDTSQAALPLGNLLVTGGVGQVGQGMAVWIHQAEADSRGPEVGYHIPRAGQVNYPLNLPISLLIHETLETGTLINGETFLVRPLSPEGVPGAFVPGRIIFAFNGTLTFTPDAPLTPDTTYEVRLTAGGVEDAAGNATEGYAFTFSTGGEVGAGNAPPVITELAADTQFIAPGGQINFTVTASDPEGQTLEYRFDAGDGSPKTPWASGLGSESAVFTYAEAGHYRVIVQVRDPQGALSTASLNITAAPPVPAQLPRQSSSVAVAPGGGIAWTVNPDSDTVTAVDLVDHLALMEFPVGADPRSVALDAAGNLWITCHDAGRVEMRSSADGTLLGMVETGYGSAPHGLVLAPDGLSGYASLYGSGRVVRFDLATRMITGTLDLGPTPRALALSGDGTRLLVSRFISPLNHGEVWEVSIAAQMTLSRTLRLPKLGGLANPDGSATGRGVPNYLAALALSPDGNSAWVAGTKPNVERGTLFGAPLDSDNTMRAMAARIDLATPSAYGIVDRTIDLDNSDSPSATIFSPMGDYLLITLQGNNEVAVFDALQLNAASTTTGLGGLLTRLSTGPGPQGLAPQGLAIDPASGRIIVQNFMGRAVAVYDGQPLFVDGQISLTPQMVSTVGVELLTPDVLAGKRVFYNAADERMSSEGYISCASCHLDGGSDGRVWDFTQRGEGLRRTTDLRGRGGMEHGNVHWSGNFDEIQDFENDIRIGFGGTGFMDDADFAATQDPLDAPKAGLSPELDALAAYVGSLNQAHVPRSPFREPNGALTAEALEGAAHFEALNCASCHAGANFTDSIAGSVALLQNVGTLRASSGQRLGQPLTGIDTPTLRGVWAQNAFFHNGSAPTLADVFRVTGGQTLQAEAGVLSGGYTEMPGGGNILANFDNTVQGGFAVVNFGGNINFNGVNGGSTSGSGAVEFRYSGSGGMANVTVNGQTFPVAVPATGNAPAWRTTFWRVARVEGVPIVAGTGNMVQIAPQGAGFAIDHVTISTPDDFAAAAPHRVALDLSEPEQQELLAYVRQLDDSEVALVGGAEVEVTLTLAPGQDAEPLVMPFVDLNVVFAEAVAGLDYADFVIGGTAGVSAGSLSEIVPGLEYRLRLAGFAQAGTISVQLPAGAAHAVEGGAQNLPGAIPPINYAPPVHDDIAPLSDEFDDPATITNWLRNNIEEGWDADKLEAWDIDATVPGRMHLMPYTSSWYQNYTGVLVYKEVTGDFVVTLNLDALRRNGLAGRPTSDYSLAGLLIRSDRGVNAAAPVPDPGPGVVLPTGNNIPPFGQPGHYATDWAAGTENYIFLSYGFGANHINANPNQWQYEVKTTINSASTLYPEVRAVPEGESNVTLQIVRRSQTFLLLRRHGEGPWIIENRFIRNDMPGTVQVGITVYTDWANVQSLDPYHHNRTVITGGNPDLVANIEYYRLRRPDPALSETALQAAAVTAQFNPIAYLADSPLATYLGDSAHAPHSDPGQTWAEWLSSQFSPAQLLDDAVSAPGADPDRDGLPNTLDYLTDGDALTPTPSPSMRLQLHAPQDPGGADLPELTLTRNPRARGYTLYIEGSSDLSAWDILAQSANGAAPTGPGMVSETSAIFPEVTLSDPLQPSNPLYDPTRRFYRLRAEEAPAPPEG